MSRPVDTSGCALLHVDMDAFYASVVVRDRPELRDVPVVVGGGHRGVVLCASYPARRHGIHSGMSGREARARCANLVEVAPDFSVLGPVSRAIMATFRTFTPIVEVVSLDEAFLDVRGARRLFGPPEAIADAVRGRIRADHRITCSVGIADAVSVAKLASRRAKPDGVAVIPPERFVAEVHPLDVGVLYGVGEPTRERLRRLGLLTVGDLAAVAEEDLARSFGPHRARALQALAWGRDRHELHPGGAGAFGFGEGDPESSMGAQHTMPVDTDDLEVLSAELLRLSERVCGRLRRAGRTGRTVALTVRYADFVTVSRSHTLTEPTDATGEVHAAAMDRLRALLPLRRSVRLVGVRVEGLRALGARPTRQLRLGEPDPGWWHADRAVDRVTARFGAAAVARASVVGLSRRR
ncbi:DNA polymerase IV [Nocardioides panacisoli]|uniref:DNA polymerase IV n=1 Tax=Nocardioides panacisoli TaxID=627624 RepID=UPI001C634408|nr:DNA polymerase IV [Nocardioides panacisoli]QYJ04728.1 DNA polymerase IV [Nocardioides panacisoli]